MPVSVTLNAKIFPREDLCFISSLISPSRVNLKALDSKLLMICWNRCTSVRSVGGKFSATVMWKASPFSSATWRNLCPRFSTHFAKVTSSIWTSILPASTLDKSRISLMRVSKSEPALWIVLAYSTCLSVKLPFLLSANSCARISRLFKGVRSSWDILARNSDLYLLANSTSSALAWMACWECSSAWFFWLISSLCCSSSRVRASSSSLVWRSSSCCVCNSSVWLCSSSDWLCNSSFWCCSSSVWVCNLSFWVLSFSAWIFVFCKSSCNFVRDSTVFTAIPILGITWLRNSSWISVMGFKEPKTITPLTIFS